MKPWQFLHHAESSNLHTIDSMTKTADKMYGCKFYRQTYQQYTETQTKFYMSIHA